INPDIFAYEVHVHESPEEIDKGEPWEVEMVERPIKERGIDLLSVVKLKERWCKAILQQKGDEHEFWASCDPFNDQCDGGDLFDNTEEKCYWCALNNDKRIKVAWEGLSLNDWIRVRYMRASMDGTETGYQRTWTR
nr:hypothetical protein [Tanacetum cinerariifolium]